MNLPLINSSSCSSSSYSQFNQKQKSNTYYNLQQIHQQQQQQQPSPRKTTTQQSLNVNQPKTTIKKLIKLNDLASSTISSSSSSFSSTSSSSSSSNHRLAETNIYDEIIYSDESINNSDLDQQHDYYPIQSNLSMSVNNKHNTPNKSPNQSTSCTKLPNCFQSYKNQFLKSLRRSSSRNRYSKSNTKLNSSLISSSGLSMFNNDLSPLSPFYRSINSPVISSGYNSCHESSLSSTILSFCSLSADNQPTCSKCLDSGISTLSNNYDSTSCSTASSLTSPEPQIYEHQNIERARAYPKVKTCLIAQIKQINSNKLNESMTNEYENLTNMSTCSNRITKSTPKTAKSSNTLRKEYSVNDVLHSLKSLETNLKNDTTKNLKLNRSLRYEFDDQDDDLCDREVDFYLNKTSPNILNSSSINNFCFTNELSVSDTNFYYNSNNNLISNSNTSLIKRPIKLWEQLV